MLIPFMISKIHNATVTAAEPNYSGSILIDADLMAQCGLRAYQKVEVYNITNGHRLATYVIAGGKGTGEITLNGAAARLASVGDRIIIAAYALLDERELNSLNSVTLLMTETNTVEKVITGSL